MTSPLDHTPLFAWHTEHGGRLVPFAGWAMPVQYTSIVSEHRATRTAVGLFDVSHMARFHFRGPGAARLLDRLVTRRVVNLPIGRICYALVTNEQGGILDDVLVYHLASTSGPDYYQLVVNASNRDKIWSWIEKHRLPTDDAEVVDTTRDTAMLAVQGPRAGELLRPLMTGDPLALKYYSGAETKVLGRDALVSRTGYTGEDGWEVVVPAAAAIDVWQGLLERGQAFGATAAGLGCRDTLRLEAAMPLYGHELGEAINPFQAGLPFAVEFEDHDFIGRAALEQLRGNESLPRRVGWEVVGQRPAREGNTVLFEGRPVGSVTSGTLAPTVGRPIAMGYVEPALAVEGKEMSIDIRGNQASARIVKLPFYRRSTR
jgi:aminomethyltransferase